MSTKESTPSYVFEQSEAEQERLILLSDFYGELTREVFVNAGVVPGMRVLDVGCGVGGVSLLAASMVGPTGSVLGVDRSRESIKRARGRASRANLANVTFREADITDLTFDTPVDAIVGRLVLCHLSNPVSVLQRLCTYLRPSGLVAFHEPDLTTVRSVPTVALFEQTAGWIRETFQRGGVALDMGPRLYSTFCQAGLPAPKLLLRARVEGEADSPVYEFFAETLRSLLPLAEKLGVTTAQEVQIDSLAARLRDEVTNAQAVIMCASFTGAWTRIQKRASSTA